MMMRRRFFLSLPVLSCLPFGLQRRTADGWRSPSELPRMYPMRLHGSGHPLRRSLNVLCMNHLQVFYGWACLDQDGRVRWYCENDYFREFPMFVEGWKSIEASRKLLHCQFYMVRKSDDCGEVE